MWWTGEERWAVTKATPVRDEHRTPRLPDNDRMVYTLGHDLERDRSVQRRRVHMRVEIDSPTADTHSSSSSSPGSSRATRRT